MKRQSIAEQTLAKQIKEINATISKHHAEIARLNSNIDALGAIRDRMSDEAYRLEAARHAASARRKV